MNQKAIDKLVDRVGWAPLLQPFATGISVDAAAAKTDSGRVFKAFHALATAENVYWTIPNPDANGNTEFNNTLLDLRKQAVLKVIDLVFVANPRAVTGTDAYGEPTDLSDTDYSDLAIRRAPLFDTAIGFQVACDVIEQLIATPRSNGRERSAGESIGDLKIELDGYTNEAGRKVAKGLYGKLSDAIKAITDVLFPLSKNEAKPVIRDASHLW